MMNDPRDKWNRRWRERLGEQLVADPWLLGMIDLLPIGRTLDLACGQGRHALELARRGSSVTAIDCSEEALSQLAAAAVAEGLQIDFRHCDLETPSPELGHGYDLLLCFFFLHRPLLPQMLESIRPGGVVVLRTFSSAGSFPSGELDSRFVLQPGELLTLFSGWDVLHHEEGEEPSRKGGSLAGIVARKLLP